MEERRQRKIGLYWEWQVIGSVSAIILFCFAYRMQDAEWTKTSEGVRIVMHALAAVAAVYCIYFTIMFMVVLVTQNLMERWLMIIDFKSSTRKILFKSERLLLKIMRPVVSAVLYIQFCYNWETLQAIEMHRDIQEEQLAVDIMFSVLMAGQLLFSLCDKAAVCPYYWVRKDVIEDFKEDCFFCECFVRNGCVFFNFIVRKLTPLIVIGLDYFIIRSMFHIVGH